MWNREEAIKIRKEYNKAYGKQKKIEINKKGWKIRMQRDKEDKLKNN